MQTDEAGRNFRLGVLHEATWGAAFGLCNPFTMLSLAAHDMGSTAANIGLMEAALFAGVNAPQVFSAFFFGPRWSDPKRVAWMHAPAVACTLGAALLFAVDLGLAPSLKLNLFMAFFVGHWILTGFIVPHWATLSGRNIPPEKLGRYFGWSFGMGGVAGAATGALGAAWVAKFGDQGYALAFGLAFVLQIISVILLGKTRTIHPPPHAPGSFTAFMASQWKRLRGDKTFQRLGILSFLMQFFGAAGVLLTAYLKEQAVPTEWFTIYNPALSLGGMLGAFALGSLLDAKGGRLAMLAAYVPMLLGILLLLSNVAPLWATLPFIATGVFNAAYGAVNLPLVLKNAPAGQTPAYMGLFGTLTAPWCLVAPWGAGLLATRFGWDAAFGMALMAGLAATALVFVWRDLGQATTTRAA